MGTSVQTVEWSGVEWRVVGEFVWLFVLLDYYWLLLVVYIDGVGVFARVRSDVLGKWRSGVRQMEARAEEGSV
jgi:hypothetical protein